MSSIADGAVQIQTSSAARLATPSWLGEVALVACHLQKQGLLTKISERVRFARRRFGRYETIDFLVVLFGYAISGERTLQDFYEIVRPFASIFIALFGRLQNRPGYQSSTMLSWVQCFGKRQYGSIWALWIAVSWLGMRTVTTDVHPSPVYLCRYVERDVSAPMAAISSIRIGPPNTQSAMVRHEP